MKRVIHTLAPIIIIAFLLVSGIACTRERPHTPVTPWAPTITLTKTTRATISPTPKTTLTPQKTPSISPTTSSTPPNPTAPESPIATSTRIMESPTMPDRTPTIPTGEKWTYYTVQRGDTLYSIAVRFGTTVEELQRLNGLSDTTIFVGQKIKVPGPGEADEPKAVEYIVQEGDTLYSIARRFGVDMEEVARANNITDPSTIYVGQRLIIPGARQTPARQLYYVQPGDTLTGIAQRFGVSLQALMEANNITDPDAIYAGQVLRIP